MSELLYKGGKKSREDPTITTLIVIPPEGLGSSRPCLWRNLVYGVFPLLWCNYCHSCFCRLSWKIENEVHVIRQVVSVHWSGKETHYTDQLPTPPSVAGELVPFWTICFILLMQLIPVCKENLGQKMLPSYTVQVVAFPLCLCMALGA